MFVLSKLFFIIFVFYFQSFNDFYQFNDILFFLGKFTFLFAQNIPELCKLLPHSLNSFILLTELLTVNSQFLHLFLELL